MVKIAFSRQTVHQLLQLFYLPGQVLAAVYAQHVHLLGFFVHHCPQGGVGKGFGQLDGIAFAQQVFAVQGGVANHAFLGGTGGQHLKRLPVLEQGLQLQGALVGGLSLRMGGLEAGQRKQRAYHGGLAGAFNAPKHYMVALVGGGGIARGRQVGGGGHRQQLPGRLAVEDGGQLAFFHRAGLHQGLNLLQRVALGGEDNIQQCFLSHDGGMDLTVTAREFALRATNM